VPGRGAGKVKEERGAHRPKEGRTNKRATSSASARTGKRSPAPRNTVRESRGKGADQDEGEEGGETRKVLKKK